MNKVKVGILTFSDGREYIHEQLISVNEKYQRAVATALEATGQFEVVEGRQVIWSPQSAREESSYLAQQGCEMTIFNYAIWCYPHLSAIATNFAPGPYLLFCNLHPSEPGMVAMLASAGTMDQLDRKYHRVWGDIHDPLVLERVIEYLKSAAAVSRLRGLTYGLFGGRPLGMYTAVANLDQWQQMFGIDVEHVEQEDVVRYAHQVKPERIEQGFTWLSEHVGQIKYDQHVLTPEKLKLQIASYHAYRQIIEERQLDFIGTKAHGDLTDTFVTLDVAEAFLNDPYDWEGPHEPIVAATEADMDGALTMQIFKHLSGQTVLFADVRHYDSEDQVWYLSNSGTHATYFAGRSDDPAENLKNVTFYPEVSYYPAGGASVHHFAAPGEVTLARLARKNGRYHLAIVPAEFVEFPRNVSLAKGATTTPEWPCAFARIQVEPEEFLATYPCNHIHGIYGDYVEALLHVANILGLETKLYR
ncbi:L-fucose/L-arabinose isomerase family protein [Bythopirellula polymerisocia]|uniref:L-fucose isomerase n=1 Tax=Bythopirellula polymerisocia TaxID=2528003 RepID=A0A5C6CEZ5_9BACT|nr:L-fucose/L-arabinose isomerase family protein [Bythopirellula polymerisocia]TWU21379.1 L-fucose isomerase [Bythopirellula polymerisocia]